MNDARRSLLKALPFTALGVFATAEASVSEVSSPDRKDTRAVFAFRLTRPAPQAAIDNLRIEVRSMLDTRHAWILRRDGVRPAGVFGVGHL